MMNEKQLAFEKYEERLMPAIVQNAETGQIMMQGFANPKAVEKTLQIDKATFWTRSRNELWTKGLTSGDTLDVVEIRTDCDNDSLLYLVTSETGKACHKEGWQSCYNRVVTTGLQVENALEEIPPWSRFTQEEQLIINKAGEGDPSVSGTAKLAQDKTTKVLAKIAEEAAEIAEAVKNPDQSRDDLLNEFADFDYQSRVLLANVNQQLQKQGQEPLSLDEIQNTIIARRK